MNEKILDLTLKLRSALDNDLRIAELSKAEREMETDDLAKTLSYKKDCAVSEYNDALRFFSRDSSEVKKAQRKLYEAKKALEELPSVRKYLEKFKEVRMLYDELNAILFADFQFDICKDHQK
ncbi:MAG: YlbF family regulator [Bacilli bacterium]|jgi:cell fate (sporulation/competence/biofilm development) regulator YlbF (YheA/YmcA/DUF963 family)|nr:YlbF family regulator [Bacilli bacterium]